VPNFVFWLHPTNHLIQLENSELIFAGPFSISVYLEHPAENFNFESL